MHQPQEIVQVSPAVNDEPMLSADEIITFAKLIDVLMEADFEINRNERLFANAC